MSAVDAQERALCARLDLLVKAARAQVPAWGEILARVDEAPFASLADFARRMPIVDKERLFGRFGERPESLVRGADFGAVRAILPSSGTSGGLLSFGFADAAEVERAAGAIDAALDALFEASRRRTLVITALPGSVHLASRAALVVEAGPRADLVALFVERFARLFDQIVLICETPFVKSALEAVSARVRLREHRIHVVVGGDYLCESLRSHLARLLGVDLDDAACASRFLSILSMGEVGLNLFAETPATVRLRRRLAARPDLIEALTGEALASAPLLLVYDSSRLLVEQHAGALVVTHLDPERLQPLLRYRTGDRGGLVPAHRLERAHAALDDAGCARRELAGAGLVWMYGRQQALRLGARTIDLPAVGEALLSCAPALPCLTGAYHLAAGGDGALEVALQLVSEPPAGANAEANAFHEGIAAHLGERLDLHVRVIAYAFEEYPWATLLPWEAKLRYL